MKENKTVEEATQNEDFIHVYDNDCEVCGNKAIPPSVFSLDCVDGAPFGGRFTVYVCEKCAERLYEAVTKEMLYIEETEKW